MKLGRAQVSSQQNVYLQQNAVNKHNATTSHPIYTISLLRVTTHDCVLHFHSRKELRNGT